MERTGAASRSKSAAAVHLVGEEPRQRHVALDGGGVARAAVAQQAHEDLQGLEAARQLRARARRTRPGRGTGSRGRRRGTRGTCGRRRPAGRRRGRGWRPPRRARRATCGGRRRASPRAPCPRTAGPAAATIRAMAPYAPSTWNQSRSRAQKSASASSGSTAPVFTVPAVPTTIAGRRPRARSSATASRERVHAEAERVVGGRSCGGGACRCRGGPPPCRRRSGPGRRRRRRAAGGSPARPSSRTLPGVIARRAAASAMKFAMDPPEARMPSALAREAHELAQPAHHAVLDVDRGVVAAPAVRVHGRGEVVGHDAQGVRGGVDEAEEARVRVAHRARHHVGAHEGEDLVRGTAGLGQRACRRSRRRGRPCRTPAARSAARDARPRSPRPGGRAGGFPRGRGRTRRRRSSHRSSGPAL